MFESMTENAALWLIVTWFLLGAGLIAGAARAAPAAEGRPAPGGSRDATLRRRKTAGRRSGDE